MRIYELCYIVINNIFSLMAFYEFEKFLCDV